MTACEILIQNGHNSEFKDPYSYPIKKLIYLSDCVKQIRNNNLITESAINHSSRIAIASGDPKHFGQIIEELSPDKK